MQTVIGLGQAGCNIADQLKQYPQYKIIKLDEGLRKTKTSFGLKRQTSPELYEENLPRGIVKYLQEGVMPETLFITSCGMVSGASLSLLSKIKDQTNINSVNIRKISSKQFRVFLGPFNNLNDLKKEFDAINVLKFENLEIIKE